MKTVLLLLTSVIMTTTFSGTFYKALKSKSLSTITTALAELDKQKQTTTSQAYKGALLMKKSNFEKAVPQKVKVFKEGAALLEAAIAKYPNNTEYRFLRLAIQENAPKVLKYNKNLMEDKAIIVANYSKLPSELKAYIKDHAAQSKTLAPTDLK